MLIILCSENKSLETKTWGLFYQVPAIYFIQFQFKLQYRKQY